METPLFILQRQCKALHSFGLEISLKEIFSATVS